MTFKLQAFCILSTLAIVGCNGSSPPAAQVDSPAAKALLKTQTYLAVTAQLASKQKEYDDLSKTVTASFSQYTDPSHSEETKASAYKAYEAGGKLQDILLGQISELKKTLKANEPGSP